MHNLAFIVALTEARRRQCPCGAVAERPKGLCRKCQARIAWRRKTAQPPRRINRRSTGRVRDADRQFVGAMPSRRTVRKGVEN